jgi:hypothetical protein
MSAVSIIDFCRVALETLTVKMEFAIPNVILRKTMIARTISVILDRILFTLLSFLYDRVVLGDLPPPGPRLKNQGTSLFRPKLRRPAPKMFGTRKEFFPSLAQFHTILILKCESTRILIPASLRQVAAYAAREPFHTDLAKTYHAFARRSV